VGEITEALRRAREEPRPSGLADGERRAGGGGAQSPAAPGDADSAASLPPPPARAPDEPIVAIARAKAADWVARAVCVEPQHAPAECFRQFALKVRRAIEGRPDRRVLVTSALRLEGKTTAACNLALALASMPAERPVALVDLDLHRPRIARGLGIHPTVGFERVLDGEASLDSARIRTEIPALDVFAIGRSRPQAHELFARRRFRDLLEALAAGYDAVVIDTPPALLVPDVALIAPHVGACLAVVRAGSTPRSAFRELLGLLPRDRLIGCFLNDARLPRHARRYGDYHRDAGDAVAAG
jgi:receptor protein-tyrosine kinase